MLDTIKAVAALIGIIVLVALLEIYPVMLLWNWLMPAIFGLPTIGFWQSFGLIILPKLIFPSSTVIRKRDD